MTVTVMPRNASPWAASRPSRPPPMTTAAPPLAAAASILSTSSRSLNVTTPGRRSEEHTSELQSLMRISYAVFCLKKKKQHKQRTHSHEHDHSNTKYEK